MKGSIMACNTITIIVPQLDFWDLLWRIFSIQRGIIDTKKTTF